MKKTHYPLSMFKGKPKNIFVFGSNEAGRHGAGAALLAKRHLGAEQGEWFGLFGQSYAIPTKDAQLQSLPLIRIRPYVDRFLFDAVNDYKDYTFYVTAIGCGLAGYHPRNIRPLFGDDIPDNVVLPAEFFL